MWGLALNGRRGSRVRRGARNRRQALGGYHLHRDDCEHRDDETGGNAGNNFKVPGTRATTGFLLHGLAEPYVNPPARNFVAGGETNLSNFLPDAPMRCLAAIS